MIVNLVVGTAIMPALIITVIGVVVVIVNVVVSLVLPTKKGQQEERRRVICDVCVIEFHSSTADYCYL